MNAAPILLDTCAALWLGQGARLSAGAEAAMRDAQARETPVFVSPITAWEIATLVEKRRIALTLPPLRWFDALIDEGVELAEMPPSVLVASASLPEPIPRDPADRIIAATAREFGYRLMTRDRPLLDFAGAGHLSAIAC